MTAEALEETVGNIEILLTKVEERLTIWDYQVLLRQQWSYWGCL